MDHEKSRKVEIDSFESISVTQSVFEAVRFERLLVDGRLRVAKFRPPLVIARGTVKLSISLGYPPLNFQVTVPPGKLDVTSY